MLVLRLGARTHWNEYSFLATSVCITIVFALPLVVYFKAHSFVKSRIGQLDLANSCATAEGVSNGIAIQPRDVVRHTQSVRLDKRNADSYMIAHVLGGYCSCYFRC